MSTPSALVAANVRAEVARQNISQAVVAEHLHIPQSGVSRRLRGVVAFSLDELTAMTALLNVPMSTFLAGVEALTEVKAS